jgi:poly(3-hydroxybutyrate) depolymerase
MRSVRGGRYHDVVFPNTPTVITDVVYGSNVNYLGQSVQLKMDIYLPACDTATNRALIIFAHGGSFVTGDKADPEYVQTATALARLGYVVASINYRLGFEQTFPAIQYSFNSAIIRGLHDGRAAIRFMRHNALNGGNTYGIDPNQIFFGGVSAGGIIALHLAYQNLQSEMTMNCGGQAGTNCNSVEGNSNNLNVPSTVRAIVSIAGGIRDLNWITNNDVPCALFHGTNDQTVPYGSGTFGGYFPVHGSSAIAARCSATNTTHCFKPMYGQDHIITNLAYVDTVAVIMRNFLEHFVCPNVTLNCNYTSLPAWVMPAVSIAVASGTTSICSGDMVTFTATTINVLSPTYQWKVNGNNAGANSNTFTTAALNNGDVITCVVTPACGNAVTSNSLMMTVNPVPVITQNGNQLTSSAASGNQWYRNGQLINGATGQTYTATQSGNYTVRVGNCESEPVNVVITDVHRAADTHIFKVFPNPSRGMFYVSLQAVATADYKLTLTSITGKLIWEEELLGITGHHLKQIDFSGIESGVYIIKLSGIHTSICRKILV